MPWICNTGIILSIQKKIKSLYSGRGRAQRLAAAPLEATSVSNLNKIRIRAAYVNIYLKFFKYHPKGGGEGRDGFTKYQIDSNRGADYTQGGGR